MNSLSCLLCALHATHAIVHGRTVLFVLAQHVQGRDQNSKRIAYFMRDADRNAPHQSQAIGLLKVGNGLFRHIAQGLGCSELGVQVRLVAAQVAA